MQINFKAIKDRQEILEVEAMASEIWREYYVPIIGKDQVAYMLKKYQSYPAMLEQIDQGYRYFFIQDQVRKIGYLSVKPENESLFLSKIYLLKDFRGMGIGKSALQWVVKTALDEGSHKVRLTVNKDNKIAIDAYEKFGFKNTGGKIFDIGEGFVMDDYVMVLDLKEGV